VDAEILQRLLVRQEGTCPLGDDDLTAVAGAHDSRRAVHVHADVTLVVDEWLARVQAHANAQLRSVKGLLSRQGGFGRIARSIESDEERIALRVDLHTA
jgi:hypothetical protein